MKDIQKYGGTAALIHAAALMVGIVLGIALIFPILGADTGQYLAFLKDSQPLVYLWNLISYWGSAASLVVMALALHERLKVGSPALALTATAFGLIWAALVIGSGNLMLRDVGTVVDLYGKDPAQAETVFLALDAVETGIVSGNELVGSVWVFLVCLAALRTGGLTRGAGYLGLGLAVPGILTLIPSLAEIMAMVFGPGMIVWSTWVGIIMLRRTSGVAAQEPGAFVPSRQPSRSEGSV